MSLPQTMAGEAVQNVLLAAWGVLEPALPFLPLLAPTTLNSRTLQALAAFLVLKSVPRLLFFVRMQALPREAIWAIQILPWVACLYMLPSLLPLIGAVVVLALQTLPVLLTTQHQPLYKAVKPLPRSFATALYVAVSTISWLGASSLTSAAGSGVFSHAPNKAAIATSCVLWCVSRFGQRSISSFSIGPSSLSLRSSYVVLPLQGLLRATLRVYLTDYLRIASVAAIVATVSTLNSGLMSFLSDSAIQSIHTAYIVICLALLSDCSLTAVAWQLNRHFADTRALETRLSSTHSEGQAIVSLAKSKSTYQSRRSLQVLATTLEQSCMLGSKRLSAMHVFFKDKETLGRVFSSCCERMNDVQVQLASVNSKKIKAADEWLVGEAAICAKIMAAIVGVSRQRQPSVLEPSTTTVSGSNSQVHRTVAVDVDFNIRPYIPLAVAAAGSIQHQLSLMRPPKQSQHDHYLSTLNAECCRLLSNVVSGLGINTFDVVTPASAPQGLDSVQWSQCLTQLKAVVDSAQAVWPPMAC